MQAQVAVKLQLGCGLTRPDGWINTDSSLNSLIQQFPGISWAVRKLRRSTRYERPATYMDVRGVWPYGAGSVDVVYASHLFEHLTSRQAQWFLKESFRVLRPGGVLRLVVPDLYALAKNYVNAYESGQDTASKLFLYAINLHQENAYGPDRNFPVRVLNDLQGYPHQHKMMYDQRSLREALEQADFVDVRESSYGKSEYVSEIRDVECTTEGIPSIYLEARKRRAS
jgi:SAM-dependent methyltransferase